MSSAATAEIGYQKSAASCANTDGGRRSRATSRTRSQSRGKSGRFVSSKGSTEFGKRTVTSTLSAADIGRLKEKAETELKGKQKTLWMKMADDVTQYYAKTGIATTAEFVETLTEASEFTDRQKVLFINTANRLNGQPQSSSEGKRKGKGGNGKAKSSSSWSTQYGTSQQIKYQRALAARQLFWSDLIRSHTMASKEDTKEIQNIVGKLYDPEVGESAQKKADENAEEKEQIKLFLAAVKHFNATPHFLEQVIGIQNMSYLKAALKPAPPYEEKKDQFLLFCDDEDLSISFLAAQPFAVALQSDKQRWRFIHSEYGLDSDEAKRRDKVSVTNQEDRNKNYPFKEQMGLVLNAAEKGESSPELAAQFAGGIVWNGHQGVDRLVELANKNNTVRPPEIVAGMAPVQSFQSGIQKLIDAYRSNKTDYKHVFVTAVKKTVNRPRAALTKFKYQKDDKTFKRFVCEVPGQYTRMYYFLRVYDSEKCVLDAVGQFKEWVAHELKVATERNLTRFANPPSTPGEIRAFYSNFSMYTKDGKWETPRPTEAVAKSAAGGDSKAEQKLEKGENPNPTRGPNTKKQAKRQRKEEADAKSNIADPAVAQALAHIVQMQRSGIPPPQTVTGKPVVSKADPEIDSVFGNNNSRRSRRGRRGGKITSTGGGPPRSSNGRFRSRSRPK